MLKRFIVSLLVLMFVLASSTLAKAFPVRHILDRMKSGNIISRYVVIPLGKALPSNGFEAKYQVFVRVKGKSKVIPLELFFATPRGSFRHVYKIGITSPNGNRLDDDTFYAFSYLMGLAMGACFSTEDESGIGNFFQEVVDTLKNDGTGEFDKTFGSLQIAAAGTYAFERGSLVFALIRSDRPGRNWNNYCTI